MRRERLQMFCLHKYKEREGEPWDKHRGRKMCRWRMLLRRPSLLLPDRAAAERSRHLLRQQKHRLLPSKRLRLESKEEEPRKFLPVLRDHRA